MDVSVGDVEAEARGQSPEGEGKWACLVIE